MRKSTRIVVFLTVVAVTLFAIAAFSENINSYCAYENDSPYTSRRAVSKNLQDYSVADTCPWYRRWIGLHSESCNWQQNINQTAGCCH